MSNHKNIVLKNFYHLFMIRITILWWYDPLINMSVNKLVKKWHSFELSPLPDLWLVTVRSPVIVDVTSQLTFVVVGRPTATTNQRTSITVRLYYAATSQSPSLISRSHCQSDIREEDPTTISQTTSIANKLLCVKISLILMPHLNRKIGTMKHVFPLFSHWMF